VATGAEQLEHPLHDAHPVLHESHPHDGAYDAVHVEQVLHGEQHDEQLEQLEQAGA